MTLGVLVLLATGSLKPGSCYAASAAAEKPSGRASGEVSQEIEMDVSKLSYELTAPLSQPRQRCWRDGHHELLRLRLALASGLSARGFAMDNLT